MKSFLYHGVGVKGYRYLATRYKKGRIIFELEPEELPEFPGQGRWVKKGFRWRRVQTLSLGFKAIWLKVKVQRWMNAETGQEFEQIPPFVRKGAKIAKALERFIVELSRFMTLLDNAAWLDLSWGTVKEVVKGRLEKDYRRIGYKPVRRIGIDEIYLSRKDKFITLVIDLETSRSIWVGAGRGGSALREFWRRMKCSGARLDAVAMDMSGAYARSVRENAPHAIITFDHFHIVKLMNERLASLRRELVAAAGDDAAKKYFKGLRWLLLKTRYNLDEDGEACLKKALDANRPLAVAYLLKEELSLLWDQPDKSAGAQFLARWCQKAIASGIAQLKAMAKTLLRHQEGILHYFTTGLTSAAVEGTNRKIRTLLRQAYGLRDREYLKLRLYALHESKLKFVG